MLATNVLPDLDEQVAVGKLDDLAMTRRHGQLPADRTGQCRTARPAEHQQLIIHCDHHPSASPAEPFDPVMRLELATEPSPNPECRLANLSWRWYAATNRAWPSPSRAESEAGPGVLRWPSHRRHPPPDAGLGDSVLPGVLLPGRGRGDQI